jgi:hypothetical protein
MIEKTQTRLSKTVGEKNKCTHVTTCHKVSNAHLHNGCVEYKPCIENVKFQQMNEKKEEGEIFISSQIFTNYGGELPNAHMQ